MPKITPFDLIVHTEVRIQWKVEEWAGESGRA